MSIASRIESMTEHLTNVWDNVDRLGFHANRLPKEYTQVDYIESSGTQYIDTGANADINLDINISLANVNGITFGAIYNNNGSYTRYHTSINNNKYTFFILQGTTVSTISTDINVKHNFYIQASNRTVIVDNTPYTLPANTDTNTNLSFWIFARNSNSSNLMTKSSFKLYSCSMYYNNVLVRDFIPCYRNSDNEVGLYDLVNNVFYTNQGTGVFTYGEIQEEHIDRNLENLSLPLKDLYNNASDKTDLSVNGVVGRTSQESTTGKNLLYISSQYDYGQNGVNGSYNENDGSFTITGTATASGNSQVTRTIPLVLEAGTYTFSLDHTISKQIYLHFNYAGGSTKNILIPAGQTEATDTLTANTTGYNIRFAVINGNTYNEKVYMQLESGSTATDWEEYTGGQPSPNPDYPQPINNLTGNVAYKIATQNGEQTFTIPLGDIELCEIETYKDKIYSSNGKFYLEKKTGNKTLSNPTVNSIVDVSSSASNQSKNGTYAIFKSYFGANVKNDTMYYNIGKYEYHSNITDNKTAQDNLQDNTFCMRQNSNDRIYFRNSEFTGKTGTQISSLINGKKVYFIIDTPTTTEITQENYPALYNALKQIQDYLTAYKINKEFILGYSSPEIEY